MRSARRSEIWNQIGARLAVIRSQNGLSQKEIAERLGVPARTYQNYELGIREVSTEVLQALLREFGASPAWIISGSDAVIDQEAEKTLEKVIVDIENIVAECDAIILPQKKAALIIKSYKRLMDGKDLSVGEISDWIEFAKE